MDDSQADEGRRVVEGLSFSTRIRCATRGLKDFGGFGRTQPLHYAFLFKPLSEQRRLVNAKERKGGLCPL